MSQTSKPSLTIWTYCVRPTSPSVSGGAQLQATPGKPMPSKLRIGFGIEFGKRRVWRAASGVKDGLTRTMGLFGSVSSSRPGFIGSALISRRGFDLLAVAWPTITCPAAPDAVS